MSLNNKNTVGRGVLVAWLIYIVWILDGISLVLIQTIESLFGVSSGRNQNIYVTAISVMFACVVGWIVYRKYKGGIRNIDYISMFKFTLLVMLDIAVVWMVLMVSIGTMFGAEILSYIVLICVILGVYVQLAAVILLFLQKNIYKEREEVIKKHLNEQKQHYESLERQEKETRKFRHDVRNHMYILSDMAKHKQYDDIKQYLKEMEMKLDSLKDNALM